MVRPRRLRSILLACALTSALVSCGGSDSPSSPPDAGADAAAMLPSPDPGSTDQAEPDRTTGAPVESGIDVAADRAADHPPDLAVDRSADLGQEDRPADLSLDRSVDVAVSPDVPADLNVDSAGADLLERGDLPGDRAAGPCPAWAFSPLGFFPKDQPEYREYDGMIVVVMSDRLQIKVGDAAIEEFYWAGPSLADHFSVGEAVRIKRELWWNAIKTSRWVAQVWSEVGRGPAVNGPLVPPWGGPTVTNVVQCSAPETIYVCGRPTPVNLEWRTYTLSAKLDADTIDVPVRESKSLGRWTVTHSGSWGASGGLFDGCAVESGWTSSLSLLGPAHE